MNKLSLPMDPLERALLSCVQRGTASALSPRLTEAVHHAVFPGGARVRPRITLAVACALRRGREPGAGATEPSELAYAAATAVELLHCATLVHDDLPCFDDAPTRRGRPSVHAVFGEPTALLVGDGLIVLAFEALATAGGEAAGRALAAVAELGRAAGIARGVVAGQALELEPPGSFELAQYHQGKTGSLFAAAAALGALAEGGDAAPYRAFGSAIGALYQVADDLADALGSAARLGKPTGKDAELARPSAVAEFGVDGAVAAFEATVRRAHAAAAACPCGGATLVPELDALVVKLRRAAGIAWDSATRQG